MAGAYGPVGLQFQRGGEMIQAEVNGAGGITVGGQKYNIAVKMYDHQGTTSGATEASNKIVFDKVAFIGGVLGSSQALAAQDVTEPAKVLMLQGGMSKEAVGPKKPYSFSVYFQPTDTIPGYLNYVRDNYPNVKKIAALGPNDATGTDYTAYLKSYAPKVGMSVVMEEFFDRSITDFGPLAVKVVSSGADLVDTGGTTGAPAGLIPKALYELGFKGMINQGVSADVAGVIKTAGVKAMEGVLIENAAVASSPLATPRDVAFYKTYKQKYNEEPGYTSLFTYYTVDAVVKAIVKANSLDTTKVRDTVVGMEFDYPFGKAKVGGEADYGIARKFLAPTVISQIRDGKVVDVATVLPK